MSNPILRHYCAALLERVANIGELQCAGNKNFSIGRTRRAQLASS